MKRKFECQNDLANSVGKLPKQHENQIAADAKTNENDSQSSAFTPALFTNQPPKISPTLLCPSPIRSTGMFGSYSCTSPSLLTPSNSPKIILEIQELEKAIKSLSTSDLKRSKMKSKQTPAVFAP